MLIMSKEKTKIIKITYVKNRILCVPSTNQNIYKVENYCLISFKLLTTVKQSKTKLVGIFENQIMPCTVM